MIVVEVASEDVGSLASEGCVERDVFMEEVPEKTKVVGRFAWVDGDLREGGER